MMSDLRCSESTTNQAQGGELLCRLATDYSPCLRVNWRDRLALDFILSTLRDSPYLSGEIQSIRDLYRPC